MKKILSFLLATLMMTALLVGCGQQQTDAPGNDEPDQPALADGVYTAEFNTDSSMFHANEACDGKGTLTVENGDVDFDHVYFKYHKDSGAWNLEDVCLHIESGMTVGILGGTGSAKSTLVSLIPRLYEATEGAVSVGCLLYTSPSPRDRQKYRMPSSA